MYVDQETIERRQSPGLLDPAWCRPDTVPVCFDSTQPLAYWLYDNGIIAENAVLDADTLTAVEMPNRDGFIWIDTLPPVH